VTRPALRWVAGTRHLSACSLRRRWPPGGSPAAGVTAPALGRITAILIRPGDAGLVGRARRLAPQSRVLRLLHLSVLGAEPERALVALRVLLVVAGEVATLAGALVLGPDLLPAGVLAACAAIALPTVALRRAVQGGADAAARDLPLALEMVAAGLRAGLPCDRAVAVAAGAVPQPLAGILRRAAAMSAAGVLGAAALAGEAEAAGIGALGAVAALMDRRQRLGLPLAPQLLAVADAARARSRAEPLARAGRRGPLAALLTATVVAPACAGGLLCLVLAGLLADGRGLGLG
jgi:hypothetical protein